MKRLTWLLVIALSTFAVDGAFAQIQNSPAMRGTDDVVGKIGLGYTTQNAPLGIRMWFAPNMGFDANIGIVLNGEERDVENNDPNATQTTADFALDAAFLFAFVQSDNSFLYVRGSVNYDRRYGVGANDNGQTNSSTDTFTIGGWIGVEFFLTALGFPEIGLQAAFGLGVSLFSGPEDSVTRPPGVDEDPAIDDWSFGSLTTGLSLLGTATLGFHYYF